jgi:hypothetical protein
MVMRRKPLSYADAVVLLGGKSKLVTALSKVAGAGLTVASVGSDTALSLFDLKGEVERLGQDAAVTLRNKLMGLNRFDRSELLQAAHAVLVVSAFFAALDDLSDDLRAALNSASMELTGAEQAAIATGKGLAPGSAGLADLASELISPGAVPGLGAGWSNRGSDLKAYYADLTRRVQRFAACTAVWDGRDETTRSRWSGTIADELPRRALTRYEERLGQLAGEFPELAFWGHRVGVQTILDELYAARRDNAELGRTVQTLAGLMQSSFRGADASKVRSDLATRYSNQLDSPIAGAVASAIPDEVTLPPLQEVYVNPSYRMLPQTRALPDWEGVSEPSWQGLPRDDDLWALVLEHLISTDAAQVPLMLLGQPGAGKSVFTQMLAAELDPRDYLVVRVELRAVPFDAGVQKQIERALEDLTGRTLPWPELVDDAGDAQSVIILDGFDELLQASEVSHFDVLEKIQEFQEREASLGRPVAVLVTSRTAVANQVRYPDGTVVVRLEEFDNNQVGRWLAAWNRANPARPLPVETAVAQGELARQPLLLFLLALFYSSGGALAPGTSQAQLYYRLFTDFVERDVIKTGTQLSDQKRRQEVRRELDLLSMVAFAMFNRGHQTVNETDLVKDLEDLRVGEQRSPMPDRRSEALTIAERMAGRFFFRLFLQRDQAIRGQHTTLSTYEFLHASFGEFLVARWVVDELSRLTELARRAADDIYSQPTDDGLLRTLLSVAVLSVREQRVLEFIADLLTVPPETELALLRALVTTLFRDCLQSHRQDPYPQYHPVTQTVPARYAVYSANLILILLLIAEAAETSQSSQNDGLALTVLYGGGSPAPAGPGEQLARFHATTRLWHAQLTASEWDGLLDVIRLDTIARTDPATTRAVPEFRISRWRHADRQRLLSGRTLLPSLRAAPDSAPDSWIWFADPAGRALRESAFLGSTGYQGACTALLPYLGVLGINSAVPELQLGDQAADMLAMLLAPGWDMPLAQRTNVYLRLADLRLGLRQARVLLNRLRDDRFLLPSHALARITATMEPLAWVNITAYLDILAQFHVTEDDGRHRLLFGYTRRQMEPSDLLGPKHNLEMMGRFGSDEALPGSDEALSGSRDQRDLNDLLSWYSNSSINPNHLVIRSGEGRGFWEPENLRELLILHDALGLKGGRDLSKLIPPPGPISFTRPVNSVVEIVLWSAIAQRRLPVSAPGKLAVSEQVRNLRILVPSFVAQTRQLAAELGYPDPFPRNPSPMKQDQAHPRYSAD